MGKTHTSSKGKKETGSNWATHKQKEEIVMIDGNVEHNIYIPELSLNSL